MDQLPPPPWPSVVTTGLVVVSAIFPVLSAVAILLRLVARRQSRQQLHADDWWIIAAWFLTLGLSILVWVYTARSGIDFYKVDFLTGTEDSLELVFISSCYVQFPLAAVKISVLLFYRRIFATAPMFRATVWGVIGLVSVWAVLFFLLVLLELDPIAFPLTAVNLRLDSTAVGLAQVASSFVLDLLVLCLPIPVISRLHMKWKRKVAVALIFWLGAFCVVAAIVRTVLLNQSIRSVVSSVSYEHVSNQSKQYIFMVLEPNCSIFAACLPTYGPLLAGGRAPESIVRSVRSIFSLRSNRDHSNSGSHGSNRSHANTTANNNTSRSKNASAHSLPRSGRHHNAGGSKRGAGESQVELHELELETASGKVSRDSGRDDSGKVSRDGAPDPDLEQAATGEMPTGGGWWANGEYQYHQGQVVSK